MKPIVHNLSGAPCGWRVLLGFVFKQIDYDVNYLEGSTKEHEGPAFRKLNPRAKVPVLEADGVAGERLVLRDSMAILAWLDRTYPARPLFGETSDEAAAIWQTALDCSEYLLPATSDVVFPVFRGDGTPPTPGTEEADTLRASAEALNAEYRLLETALGDKAFLCGDNPTAADAVVFPETSRVWRALETRPKAMASIGYDRLGDRFPRLSAWQNRVASLSGVAETEPPHWKISRQADASSRAVRVAS